MATIKTLPILGADVVPAGTRKDGTAFNQFTKVITSKGDTIVTSTVPNGTPDGVVVRTYAKGEQCPWTDKPFDKEFTEVLTFTTIGRVKNAKQFSELVDGL